MWNGNYGRSDFWGCNGNTGKRYHDDGKNIVEKRGAVLEYYTEDFQQLIADYWRDKHRINRMKERWLPPTERKHETSKRR